MTVIKASKISLWSLKQKTTQTMEVHPTFSFSYKCPGHSRGVAPAPSLLSNYDLPRDNTPRIQIRNGESGRRPRWSIAGPRPNASISRAIVARESRGRRERYEFGFGTWWRLNFECDWPAVREENFFFLMASTRQNRYQRIYTYFSKWYSIIVLI